MSKKVDYLTEDKELPGQKYACVSIITPENVKGCEKMDVRAFKIRGVYNSYEGAVERAKALQQNDPIHNVYVADVGKWLPLCDDPERAKEENYANDTLNTIMKNDRDNKEKAKMYHEQRKNMMIQEARSKVDKKRKKKKKKRRNLQNKEDNKEDDNEEDKNDLVIKNDKETEKELKKDVEELKEEDNKLYEKENKLNQLTSELESARLKYEQLKKEEEKKDLKVANANV